MQMVERRDNFGAGPAALPVPVLEQAQRDLLNFRGSGMSIMEISHRHALYEQVQHDAEARLRRLMGIPDDYKVLFLQGGASLQFSMLPMNFLHRGGEAGYVLTGSWSEKALAEANRVGTGVVCASSKDAKYNHIPDFNDIRVKPSYAYVHVTSNNTIYGSQWSAFPNISVPLVADMSSDILSRPIDVSQFQLIYAGAQKNLGPSGLTAVIVKETWLADADPNLAPMLSYPTQAKNDSRYNTPPTFAIYMLGLVLEWVESVGGLAGIADVNEAKANVLYGTIDGSNGFYRGVVEPDSRSRMNVTFTLPTADLETQFLASAKADGFVGLSGHRSVGGCRASIYNAVSLASCTRLSAWMTDFQNRHA